jgi:hypothetical protein
MNLFSAAQVLRKLHTFRGLITPEKIQNASGAVAVVAVSRNPTRQHLASYYVLSVR